MKTFLSIFCLSLIHIASLAQMKDSGYKGTKSTFFVYNSDGELISEKERQFSYQLVMYKGEFLIKSEGRDWIRALATYEGKKNISGSASDVYRLSNGSTIAVCLDESFISWALPQKEGENTNLITFYDIKYSFTTYMDGIDAWDTWSEEREKEQANINYSSSSETEAIPEQAQPEQQGRFREDYNVYTIYEVEKGKWTNWDTANTSFVFNYNSNSDIMAFYASGDKELFRKISKIESGETDDGNSYQAVTVIDGEGIQATIQVFAKKEIGIIIRYSNMYIQFAEK